MKLLEKFKSRKLNFDITLTFISIISFVAGTILWYFSYNTKEISYTLSKQFIKDMNINTLAKINNKFEVANDLAKLGSKVFNEIEQLAENNNLISFMIDSIERHEFLANMYVGDQQGNYIGLVRIALGSTYRSNPANLLPGDIKYAIRSVQKDETGKTFEKWTYLSKNKNIIDTEIINDVEFDPRTRPWYVGAYKRRAAFWTKVYLFSENGRAGITASQPIKDPTGKLIGVFGSDLEVTQFGRHLMLHDTTEHPDKEYNASQSFIISNNGEIITHSTIPDVLKIQGDRVIIKEVQDVQNLPLIKAFGTISTTLNFDDSFIVKVNNIEFITNFTKIQQDFENEEWYLGRIVPITNYTADFNKIIFHAIIFCIIVLILSTTLVVFLSNRISKPINKLSSYASKLKLLDLLGIKPVKSNVKEVQRLSLAMTSMKKSLEAFGKFIPNGIVAQLIKKDFLVKIGGRRRELTIFFSDIEGFTSVSENVTEDALMNILYEYFDELTKIIHNQKGTVDKYIGDSIMAFWGAPYHDKFQSLHACETALLIQRKLVSLNRKWRSQGLPVLKTRIGIHKGEVIVGNMGSSDRVNYSILGDGVNLAARLEGVNKMYGTYLLISEDVFKDISKKAICRPLDIVAVKGKKIGTKIYELVGMNKSKPSIIPSAKQTKICKMFTEGFVLYTQRHWDEAIKTFEKIINEFGQDQNCTMYIERCKQFKKTPPPKKWDGIIQLTTK